MYRHKEDIESILIVGSGTVGLARGTALAGLGHRVRYCDTSPIRRAELSNQRVSCDAEVQLDDLSQIVMLCVPTPANNSGYDLCPLEQALREVALSLKKSSGRHLIAISSTVPPSTTRNIAIPLIEGVSGLKEGQGYDIAALPEFIRESRSLDDAKQPWITIIGAPREPARNRLEMLFRPLGGKIESFADPTVAELIKVAHNAYNATKISFFNEIFVLSSALGVEIDDVAGAVAQSAEGSFNINYGIHGGSPFEGKCLPKDLDGLIAFADMINAPTPLLKSIRQVNDYMRTLMIPPETVQH